ncbi:prolyl oligopeptidase family serine peptidase [Flavihumibacter rivuli]|uniref:alpha/beta hydrolase family protein n=1 Tax=Flavihumibacter rivuli TaxID=2838156 RepID=UPI001BDE500E|nr:prolyl oligopeptidase family serine peptidase [Flavihumibacter rivuli]ULQ57213.1 prolyl oligopeptidase family serine peptidase [Flavihumibacter rivuli]
MRRLKLVFALCILAGTRLLAQDDISYQQPPKDIADMVNAKPTPSVAIDARGEWMIIIDRASYGSVEELAQPEIRVAGIRWNPANFGQSRQNYFNGLQLKNIRTGAVTTVKGLPENLRGNTISWNQDENAFAFLHYSASQVDLYVVTIDDAAARKANQQPVNAVLGNAFAWVGNGSIIYRAAINAGKPAPQKPLAPSGPVAQQSLGKAAASRTYQDLIKSPYDEALFEFYSKSQLVRTDLINESVIGEPAIYRSFSVSPDQQYLLTATISKPFSYLVPWSGFPTAYAVKDMKGSTVRELFTNPSSEGAPIGFDDVVNFPRNIGWRDDEPATVTYVQALDKGLGRTKVPHRDALYALTANGKEPAKELFRTQRRFGGVSWGNASLALFYERSFADRKLRINRYNPTTGAIDSLNERSSNDEYSDIGSPVTRKNSWGREVLWILKNGDILLTSDGASTKGDLPLLRTMNPTTRTIKDLWRCQEGAYEYVVEVLDPERGLFITRRETPTHAPNYFLRDLRKKSLLGTPLTSFTNPYPQLEGITKEKISYKRADGIDLTATLYLPKGYDKSKGPLPVLIWAYPIEYKSQSDAAQVRGSKYTFPTVSWGSPVYWVTQGYAVMDNTEMPIVGEGDKEPNDNFIPQLYLNAHAAIQAVAKMGVGDSTRVGVGGHSYGAFMTANLLAHTNLFKAGIARSGAYNRTLTPFGFQAEERTYWQAPDVYYKMSPFSYADKIKTPLLLVHGDADNNPGTFPIQSERLYNAIKGHGGTVRFVSLPYESHGYAGKENILHLLWEQNQWLEKYVKGSGEKKAF